eukprot:COSAG02_NODE_1133_length_14390_cov_3.493178_7_plen_62_part_00
MSEVLPSSVTIITDLTTLNVVSNGWVQEQQLLPRAITSRATENGGRKAACGEEYSSQDAIW